MRKSGKTYQSSNQRFADIFNLSAAVRSAFAVSFCLLLMVSVVGLYIIPVHAESEPAQASSADDKAILSFQSKLNDIKGQKKGVRAKVLEARKKEKLALAKLEATQRQLAKYQRSYNQVKTKVRSVEGRIVSSEEEIIELQQKAYAKAKNLKVQLHTIYMKKASLMSSFFDSLMSSHSVTEFLHTLYYQKKILEKEMSLVRDVRARQIQLKSMQEYLRGQREQLKRSRKEAEHVRNMVLKKKRSQQHIVHKLRKERKVYEMMERRLEQEANSIGGKIVKLTGKDVDLGDRVLASYIKPVPGRITSRYGYRTHPIFKVRSFHSGVDIGAGRGTPIKSSNGGIVIYSGWYTGYGNTVIVSHGKNKSTLYAHLRSISVSTGEEVRQGNIVGYVGSTGYSTGPHLHFEYRINGKHTNPRQIL